MPRPKNGYKVIPAGEEYRGNTYSDWISVWLNWWFSADPDQNNSGPVVFLKSVPSASKLITEPKSIEKSEYGGRQYSKPNVMVGKDKLEVYEDQAILLPIMTANWIAVEKDTTEAFMRQWVRNQTNMSDNPPQDFQITVNGNPIQFVEGDEMAKHRIETPLFQIVIPDTQAGTSLKDFVDQPLPPGPYNAVVDGYFLLLCDFKLDEYIIHNLTRGSPRSSGQDYYAEYLYQIEIRESSTRDQSPRSGRVPSRLLDLMKEELDIKLKNNEISEDDKEEFLGIVNNSRGERLKSFRKIVEIMGSSASGAESSSH